MDKSAQVFLLFYGESLPPHIQSTHSCKATKLTA